MAPERTIFLADCQSFYASIEKAEHPEYAGLPVAVAGDPERRSGIILAACPQAKKHGVTTAQRLGEALACCPELVVVRPRMQYYVDVSMHITTIYQSYTDLVEPYSIDEQFLDVTGSLHLYGSAEQLAQLIQSRILKELGIYVRIGIGPNKILAKTACDNFAKKINSGIFTLHERNIASTLWNLPIGSMFMVGRKMSQHFAAMGLDTIGKLAATPLDRLKLLMRRKFAKNSDINAELYWRIANGMDNGAVAPGTHEAAPKSVGHMMTLPRDYSRLEEIKIILLELTELVCQRCRSKGIMGHVISVGCAGADFDRPTGFSRQVKMPDPSNITNQVYKEALQLLLKHWDRYPIRRVGVSLSQFSSADEYQMTLFDENREKSMALERATDAIKRRYGDAAILRAVSVHDAGQARHRAEKIGGHYK